MADFFFKIFISSSSPSLLRKELSFFNWNFYNQLLDLPKLILLRHIESILISILIWYNLNFEPINSQETYICEKKKKIYIYLIMAELAQSLFWFSNPLSKSKIKEFRLLLSYGPSGRSLIEEWWYFNPSISLNSLHFLNKFIYF